MSEDDYVFTIHCDPARAEEAEASYKDRENVESLERARVDFSKLPGRWLEDVDFGAILLLAETILAQVRQLADWAQEGPLDETAATMLLGIGDQWLVLESFLAANDIGPRNVVWYAENDDDELVETATCWRDLVRLVRRDAEWLDYNLSSMYNFELVSRAPNARMGMPHAVFAKRLAVAIELLSVAVDMSQQRGMTADEAKGMTADEANQKAMTLAKQYGAAFFTMSLRKQAQLIGCHYKTWKETALYKAALADGRICPPKPRGPKVVSFTPRREAATGEGGKNEIQKLVAEAELRRLKAEQARDHEPSPLEEDPSERERKVRSRKRL
jgi:hypothetical protein